MLNARELYKWFCAARIIHMDAPVTDGDDSGQADAQACRNRRELLSGVMDEDCKLQVLV